MQAFLLVSFFVLGCVGLALSLYGISLSLRRGCRGAPEGWKTEDRTALSVEPIISDVTPYVQAIASLVEYAKAAKGTKYENKIHASICPCIEQLANAVALHSKVAACVRVEKPDGAKVVR